MVPGWTFNKCRHIANASTLAVMPRHPTNINSMTLHEAIAQLLRQIGQPMTAREIADGLNKNKWYTKADKSEIKTSQITARVDDHHELFDIDRSTSPLRIKLFGKQSKPIK